MDETLEAPLWDGTPPPLDVAVPVPLLVESGDIWGVDGSWKRKNRLVARVSVASWPEGVGTGGGFIGKTALGTQRVALDVTMSFGAALPLYVENAEAACTVAGTSSGTRGVAGGVGCGVGFTTTTAGAPFELEPEGGVDGTTRVARNAREA